MDELRLRQPLAGDGQERVAGVEAGDFAPKLGGKDARPTAPAPGIEEPHSRLHSQCQKRVLPEGEAERFLQFRPVTWSRAP